MVLSCPSVALEASVGFIESSTVCMDLRALFELRRNLLLHTRSHWALRGCGNVGLQSGQWMLNRLRHNLRCDQRFYG